jgi:hypothetical protein
MQLAKIYLSAKPVMHTIIPHGLAAFPTRPRPREGTNGARGPITCAISNYHSRLRVISFCSQSCLLEIGVPFAYPLAALGHARPLRVHGPWSAGCSAFVRVHGNSQLPDCMNLVSQHVLMAHSLRARKAIPMRIQKATCRW